MERFEETMEDGFYVDMERIASSIRDSEVLCVYFPMLRKTLLVDFRSIPEDPPIIRLVPMARNPEERMRYLRRMRPSLPRPHVVGVIAWPRLVGSLLRMGVFDQIKDRLNKLGDELASSIYEKAMRELQQLERAELAAVVRGDNYHTVWARKN